MQQTLKMGDLTDLNITNQNQKGRIKKLNLHSH